jgi:TonB family protein
MKHTHVCLVLGILLLLSGATVRVQSQDRPQPVSQAAAASATVQANEAEQNLIKKVPPVYPPLAKQVRIQGKVKVHALISKTGVVEAVNVVSGHPLLVQAAINAVKQWQYKPFVVNGQAVAASTEIEVPFSLGIPDATYQSEQKNSEAFFKRQAECRELLRTQKYAEAEAPCTSLVELGEKLPKERQLERMTANELAGHAVLYQKKFDEALRFFQTELAIGEATLKPTDAELGYAYHHVGLAYYAGGNLPKAQSFYEKSEATLHAAREHMDGEFFKNQYAKDIQGVLREYIVILRQEGQANAAAKAQERADAIALEIHSESSNP